MMTVAGGIVVFCGDAFDALLDEPEFEFDEELEVSLEVEPEVEPEAELEPEVESEVDPEVEPEVDPDVSVEPVPPEITGDEPFTTAVAPLVELVIPEVVAPAEVATPEVVVSVEGAAAVPSGVAELLLGEPLASAELPPPPPPHALNTTLPPSAVRQPRN